MLAFGMVSRVGRVCGLLGAAALIACGGSGGGFDFDSAGMGSAASNDGDGSGSGSGDSGSGSGSDDGEPGETGEDTMGGADSGSSGSSDGADTNDDDDLPVVPCTGIDILFVVDNSETMLEEQIRIQGTAANWLSMVNASAITASNNLNVGVITTDEPELRTVDSTGASCGFASGLPFMQYGQPLGMFDPVAFAAELGCALDVGLDGSSNERPIDMIREALSPALTDGGANDGFLRTDSLLLIVLLTDEEDDFEAKTSWGSDGDPDQWIADVAAFKGDIEKDVVVLSLIGVDPPNECPPHQWDGMTGAELSPRLAQFTDGFPAGAVHDLCSQDYTSFLNGVVPGISGSCANFSTP